MSSKNDNSKGAGMEKTVTFARPTEKEIDRALDALKHDEEKDVVKQSGITMPILTLLLSFIIPFSGCIFYCSVLYEKKDSERQKWALRSLYTSCAVAAVYAYIISSLIREFSN